MSSSVAVWFVEGTRKKTRMNARALKPLVEGGVSWGFRGWGRGDGEEEKGEEQGVGKKGAGAKRETLLTRINRAVWHAPN